MAATKLYTEENIIKAITYEEQTTQEIAKKVYSDITHKKGIARTTLLRELENLLANGEIEKIRKKGKTGSPTGLVTYWRLPEEIEEKELKN
jgi:antitoxin component YwqK of YwqJK toxin-antitoxin module